MDTVPGAKTQKDCVVSESTISRFACRIIVERNPPHTSRIYAAGFNSTNNIFLGVSNIHLDDEIMTSWNKHLNIAMVKKNKPQTLVNKIMHTDN